VKIARQFAALMLIAGACLVFRAAYLEAKATLAGILIRRAWEQSLATGHPHAPWPWADTHPIARLRIPQLHYDEMVLEDATPRNLAFGPARLLSGADFGGPGNLVLAGHRTSWFKPLQNIVAGDTIQVEWFDQAQGGSHERSYEVQIVSVVDPKDVSLLEPTSEDALTLITCYPFGSSPYSPKRFVVRALPIGPATVKPSSK
jgi:sortase A